MRPGAADLRSEAPKERRWKPSSPGKRRIKRTVIRADTILHRVYKYMGHPAGKRILDARWVRTPVKTPQKRPREKARAMVKMVSIKSGKPSTELLRRERTMFSAAPAIQRSRETGLLTLKPELKNL
jgi:hypothetical protein